MCVDDGFRINDIANSEDGLTAMQMALVRYARRCYRQMLPDTWRARLRDGLPAPVMRLVQGLITREQRRGREIPGRFVGGVWANRAGLQANRCLVAAARHRMRAHPPISDVQLRRYGQELEDQGIVVIPDFLAPDAFEAVLAEFRQCYGDDASYRKSEKRRGPALIHNFTIKRSQSLADFAAIARCVTGNPSMYAIIGYAARTAVRIPPHQNLQQVTGIVSAKGDSSGVWHGDYFDHVFKAWLYIEPTSDSNGAFFYAPQTNRLSPARLRYEHRLAVFNSRARRPGSQLLETTDNVGGVRVPTAEEHRALDIRPRQVCAAANTLVIADTFGFHRRGDMEVGAVRRALHMDFRFLRTAENRYAG